MNKELIINVAPTGVEIALLEDKKLVELHNEKADASFAVGDLYLGKVKKLIPGLNAAFVDVGFEKDAFLHYTDLSPYARSIIKFTQVLLISFYHLFCINLLLFKLFKLSIILFNTIL